MTLWQILCEKSPKTGFPGGPQRITDSASGRASPRPGRTFDTARARLGGPITPGSQSRENSVAGDSGGHFRWIRWKTPAAGSARADSGDASTLTPDSTDRRETAGPAEPHQVGALAHEDLTAVVQAEEPRRRERHGGHGIREGEAVPVVKQQRAMEPARRHVVGGEDIEQPALRQLHRRHVAGVGAAAHE